MTNQLNLTKISDLPFGSKIDASSFDSESLYLKVNECLDIRKAAYITNFPKCSERFIAFLSRFGKVLSNYGQNSSSEVHDFHPCVNRVRVLVDESQNKYVHGRSGNLPPHSARSWSKLRPRYFAILMINPGWQNLPFGNNGESICVRWRDALMHLQKENIDQFENIFHLLSSVNICFAANNVIEELSELPLIYSLSDSINSLDVGGRIKSDLRTKLGTLAAHLPDSARYIAAVERFLNSTNNDAVRSVFQMVEGDLMLLDNNRFGHGRLNVVATHPGQAVSNPRELWSTSVA